MGCMHIHLDGGIDFQRLCVLNSLLVLFAEEMNLVALKGG